MRFLPSLLVACSVVFTTQLFSAPADVRQYLEDGQKAMIRGDYAAAKKSFDIVVQVDPKNPTANNYLRMIQTKEAAAPKGNEIEKQLSTVVLPKVDFREATLAEVFEFLRQQVTKVSGGKQNVNFVLQIPEPMKQTPITLQLSNIPVTAALQYLGDLGNIQLEYQKYAIKVTPRTGAPGTTAAPLPSGSDTPARTAVPAVPGL